MRDIPRRQDARVANENALSYGASFFFGRGCVSRISHSPEWAKNSFNKIRLRDSSTLSESGSKEQKQAKQ